MSHSDLSISCPSGGNFHICQRGAAQQFLGCCISDPCVKGGLCPQGDLRASSFNASAYNQIRPQTCLDGTAAEWYTCSQTSPPFLGCCLSNACNKATGCPGTDLVPARLLTEEDTALFTTTTSASAEPPEILTTSMAGPSATSAPIPTSSHTVLAPGAWAGISAAFVAFIALLSVLLYTAYRKRRQGRCVPAVPHRSPTGPRGQSTILLKNYSALGREELDGSAGVDLAITQNARTDVLGPPFRYSQYKPYRPPHPAASRPRSTESITDSVGTTPSMQTTGLFELE